MELDTTLLQADIYRIHKNDIIQILRNHNIPCKATDTSAELRPILATLKSLIRQSQSDPFLQGLLLKTLNKVGGPLSQIHKEQYKDLDTLDSIIKAREPLYDLVASDTDSHGDQEDNNYDTVNLNLPKVTMTENLPLISAGTFTGLQSENPNDFLDKYNIAAVSNKWSQDTKLNLFPAHLSGTALSWYKHYQTKAQNQPLNWNNLTAKFLEAFTPTAQTETLQSILDRKIQGENQPTLHYFLDIVTTCKRFDTNVTDKQIINYVIQGLKPQICDRILSMTNDSLDNLENNLKIAENYLLAQKQNRAKFNRVSSQTTSHTDTNLLASLQTEIKFLTDSISNLNFKRNNQSPIPSRTSSPHRRPQNYSKFTPRTQPPKRVYFEDQNYNTYSNYKRETPSSNRFCNICKTTTHNTEVCWYKQNQHPSKQSPRVYKQPTQNNTRNPTSNLFCNYCKRTNHNIDTCFRSKYYKGQNHQKNE